MKRGMRSLLALLTIIAAPVSGQALLPTPAAMRAAGEGFSLAGAAPMAHDAGARNAADRLADLLATSGTRLGRAKGATVRFERQPGMAAESYRLTTGPGGAVIQAGDDAGLLHGAVTLWQLAARGRVPGVVIDDRPRFAWRGVMLDSARHMQSVGYIHRLIDAMMAAKLNRLHWHLVDDQGWRLPVPGWPRLTSVSAFRRAATAPGAPPLPVEGGFYTEAQIRAIVAYATARGVTIVPEIEMPGHALAAIRAYPKLGMGVAIPPGTQSDYGVFPWLYNSDDATFGFLEDVLRQVMRLFPGRDIHIGGDEAVKDQWRASPVIQAKVRALGLKDEDALQGWFMARIGRFLAAHGRRPIGWDEILDGGVPADAAITSWRGVEGAVKAARSGHDAILSPAPLLYLDNRQGTGPAEPPGRGRLVTLAELLAFDPVPPGLSPAEQRRILGVQANLWTEHVRTDARAAWMTWPRALAVAEVGWAGPGKRELAASAPALVAQMDRLEGLGVRGADSAWAVTARLDRQGAGITATLANQAALPIRYTLDGGAPGPGSMVYAAPLTLAAGQRLRATSFLGTRALAGGYDRAITLDAALTRTSRELTLCSDAVALDLEDDWPATGPRAHFLFDIFNPCWRWTGAPLAGVRSVALSVGQVPFNFQVGADRDKVRFRAPATPAGEFEVRDGCQGPLLATLPLAPAVANPGVTRLTAPLRAGKAGADLCVTYTARGVDPLWAVERIELLP